ncbi:hypothetical protein ZWY2020_052148, partial [Hordeum vulgare]
LNYIDPNKDTLMVKLANSPLRVGCRFMLGTDKRATGLICAFHFRVNSKQRLVLIVHRL